MMSVTVSSASSGSSGPSPSMSAISDLDQFALLGEIQLDLGLGKQFLDPAGQLRLEGGARHLGRGGDVHVFEDERLDLRLGRVDRAAMRGCAVAAGVGRAGRRAAAPA